MVGGRIGAPLRGRSRAQILLAGAILLAVLLVALVVTVNGMFVSQGSVDSQASSQISDAREFDFEARRGARSLVLNLNHEERNRTADELGDVVSAQVRNYSHLLAESYAASRGEYVNLTYNDDSSAFGRRIVQLGDHNITDPDGTEDWPMVPDDELRQIGRFVLNVDVEATSAGSAGDSTVLRVENGDDASVEFALNRTSAGNLGVKTTVRNAAGSPTGGTYATCDPSRDRVLVELVAGEAFSGECQFNGTAEIAPPYSVGVDRGRHLNGSYELAINESAGGFPTCDDSLDAIEVCESPIVWEANVTTGLQGSEIAYEKDFNVSIYEDAP